MSIWTDEQIYSLISLFVAAVQLKVLLRIGYIISHERQIVLRQDRNLPSVFYQLSKRRVFLFGEVFQNPNLVVLQEI